MEKSENWWRTGRNKKADREGFYDFMDVFETKYRVKSLVDLEGGQVLEYLDLSEDNILMMSV